MIKRIHDETSGEKLKIPGFYYVNVQVLRADLVAVKKVQGHRYSASAQGHLYPPSAQTGDLEEDIMTVVFPSIVHL